MRRLLIPSLLVLSLVACDRGQPPAPPATSTPAPDASTGPTAPPVAEVKLTDVVETTPDYVIGITYPPSASRYPGLAVELKAYADAARGELMEALPGRAQSDSGAMYELSLTFSELYATPELVAIAADGNSYTGGAHGNPLIARFVWLPQQGKSLKASELVTGEAGWKAIAGYVREQLHTALSQRVDADDLPPAERADVIKSAGKMIDEGTDANPENFAQFEPLAGTGGKLSGLRFVFAPYQVGPYSDGTQHVEVPAAVLLPHVAPQYRGLFAAN